MGELEQVTVILGAGASFDVHNGSVPILNPEMKPPLAKQLFEARFWNIAGQYAGVKVLGAELGRIAQLESAFDLEERLSQYASSTDTLTRRHFKDIPPYLRDVLIRVTNDYVPSPTNYLNLVRRLLHGESHEICFVSLNYDTLLERALEIYDAELAINQLDDYVAEGRRAWVVKIHGSTNWAVEVPLTAATDGGRHLEDVLQHWDPSDFDADAITLDNRNDGSRRWRDLKSGAHLYPALTAPLRDKSFTCPRVHTERLREFLQTCRVFLVIGSSGLDDDLLGFLSQNVPTGKTVVQYVNNGLEATLAVRERFEENIRQFRGGKGRSAQPRLAHKGFTEYLDGSDLEEMMAGG